MKALLLIDLQNDFLPGGALAVPEGDQVLPIANELMKRFPLVFATQDWHPANHKSFASQHAGVKVGQSFDLHGLSQMAWPDHCIQGSTGALLSSTLNIATIKQVVQKGTDAEVDSYSGFFDNGHRIQTELDRVLKTAGVEHLYVMGLATDYCVKFTVLDALDLGYSVTVVTDGCRGVELTEGDCQKAIDEMRSGGALFCASQSLLAD